jgi:hypothetical protein
MIRLARRKSARRRTGPAMDLDEIRDAGELKMLFRTGA